MKRYVALFLFLVLVGVCVGRAQLFYKVEGNGLAKPSYLFGTHHLAPVSIIDSIDGCRKALGEVDAVVGEIDMTGSQLIMALKMQKYLTAPKDSTLRKIFTPEEYARVNESFQRYTPQKGLKLEMLDKFKPMYLQSLITIQMIKESMPEVDLENQLDTYFQQQGKKLKKKVIGLETAEYQADLLYNSTSIADQAKSLLKMIDSPQESLINAEKLNTAYFAGDLDALYDLMKEEGDADPGFEDRTVNRRNQNWLKELPALMAKRSCFIAVGALHLPGEEGVIAGLRSLGYTVTPCQLRK